jgi:hypothetical protein
MICVLPDHIKLYQILYHMVPYRLSTLSIYYAKASNNNARINVGNNIFSINITNINIINQCNNIVIVILHILSVTQRNKYLIVLRMHIGAYHFLLANRLIIYYCYHAAAKSLWYYFIVAWVIKHAIYNIVFTWYIIINRNKVQPTLGLLSDNKGEGGLARDRKHVCPPPAQRDSITSSYVKLYI